MYDIAEINTWVTLRDEFQTVNMWNTAQHSSSVVAIVGRNHVPGMTHVWNSLVKHTNYSSVVKVDCLKKHLHEMELSRGASFFDFLIHSKPQSKEIETWCMLTFLRRQTFKRAESFDKDEHNKVIKAEAETRRQQDLGAEPKNCERTKWALSSSQLTKKWSKHPPDEFKLLPGLDFTHWVIVLDEPEDFLGKEKLFLDYCTKKVSEVTGR